MKTFASTEHDANSISGMGVFTLVIWIGCALISVFGFILPYAHPRAPQAQPPPLKVEALEVKFADDPPPTESPQNSTITDPLAQPQIPQPVAVALPSPAIAFALPVKGPVQIVAARYATHTQAPPVPAVGPATEKLVLGIGEGRLPLPDYPPRAKREGQEGVVGVRLTVAEDGHVVDAQIVEPCRWSLLNQEALRWGKYRCHFTPGKPHIYDIPVRFVMKE